MHSDFSDIIGAQHALRAVVKTEFDEFYHYYHKRFQKTYKGYDKGEFTITHNSWLNDLAVEMCLKQLILERPHLNNCIVTPVYSHSILTSLSESKVYQELLASKKSYGRYLIPTESILFQFFLEWCLQNHKVANLSGNQIKQIIIPILINKHYTIAVVKLTNTKFNKLAHIEFYNSFGDNLGAAQQDGLKSFFRKLGFIPKYENIAKHDQKDSYNCGVFIIYKALEIASKNTGVDEVLLPMTSMGTQNYEQTFLNARNLVASILEAQNINVLLATAS